jgi:hypothetical protein
MKWIRSLKTSKREQGIKTPTRKEVATRKYNFMSLNELLSRSIQTMSQKSRQFYIYAMLSGKEKQDFSDKVHLWQ